jgi:hypothetical protein
MKIFTLGHLKVKPTHPSYQGRPKQVISATSSQSQIYLFNTFPKEKHIVHNLNLHFCGQDLKCLKGQ